MSTNPKKLAENAINNINEDRGQAKFFITKYLEEIADGKTSYKETGHIIAKFLETLQRSNEQLVKLTALFEKNNSTVNLEFSESEKQKIYDKIKDPDE
jgi:uncharacterized protein with von Willebrand factor type A (vWA) domain|tara:strand:+ start:2921 stop:3214 length:294 start_codon:yes stop_codon:yes gene_type:complete